MNDQDPAGVRPAASSRRLTLVMLAGWLAAALLAGAGSSASANPTIRKAPLIVHTGPQCLAGQGASPAKK